MADPTYGATTAPQAGTTSVAVTSPATTAGNKMYYFASTNGSAISHTLAGWTFEVEVTGGTPAVIAVVFSRTATGSEGGTVYTVTGMTGGTKSLGYIVQFAPGTAGDILTPTWRTWIDSDNTSTAVAGTAGSAWTSTTDCIIANAWVGLAPSGTYSGSTTGRTISQAGATITSTSRFGGGYATNSGAYGFETGDVTSPGTGAPSFAATTVGANWSGVGIMLLLTETPSTSPGPSGETLQRAMQRVSGTDLDAQGAANVWAGTTGLDLLGALNTKAGNARGSWVGLNAVLNQLAGTTGLDAQAAADAISA